MSHTQPSEENRSTAWANWRCDFESVDALCTQVHKDNLNAGWWNAAPGSGRAVNDVNVLATKIALIHSEVSEMLEGLRKGQPDDHLPEFPMEHVEAADILIRLLDYCGARGIRLGHVAMKKMLYNQHREDHKKENREKEGGKKF